MTITSEVDPAGRTVQRMVREPEWDDEQRAYVVEYLAWRRRIGPHGHPMDEATSPLADPANENAQWRYYADPLPIVDYAMREREMAREAYKKQIGEEGSMAGLIFTVERVNIEDRPRLL
ncbi:MAG: hypothetical protein D3X82_16900 [Candidatus Leucobacter sulfamidivorax]|nr:hypothetical protein [Candidatus Leucobacter sulfamidivorax]